MEGIGLLKFTIKKLCVKLKEGGKELGIVCAERDEVKTAIDGMRALLVDFKKNREIHVGSASTFQEDGE